ncbi:hypothetical protein [Lyngbya aestuarii]|uniref:hypothetical protein n=1 Tax=Lyngbya aestuarii TaxID=118322 RepID=UPI00403DF06C
MKWKKFRPFILGLLSTILILLSGVSFAVAEVYARDFVKIGSDVAVTENQVVNDAVAIGGSVTLFTGGQTRGDAVAIGGDVILESNALIDGDAVAIGGKVFKKEGARIGGDTVEIFSGAKVFLGKFGLFGTIYLVNLLFYLFFLLLVLAFGIFLILLLPGHLHSISLTISQHPFKSAVWGLGGIVASVLCILLISGSILGMVLVPLINLAVLVTGLLGCTGTSLWIGGKIYSARGSSRIKEFLVGMLLLALISLIPLVGGLIILMVNIFGFGAALLSRFGTTQPEIIDKKFDQLEGSVN